MNTVNKNEELVRKLLKGKELRIPDNLKVNLDRMIPVTIKVIKDNLKEMHLI